MGSSVSDSSSGDDMDIDDDLSAQPLAKLLQDADSLTRRTDSSTGSRRKLRPEVIDVQRMKDIATSGPVRSFPLLLEKLRDVCTNISCLVCRNMSTSPQLPSPPHLFGAQLQHCYTSPTTATSQPKSSPHNPARQKYTHDNHTVPPFCRRSPHIPRRSP